MNYLAKSLWLGLSILAYASTGYRLSQPPIPSIPSEEHSYADVDAAYNYLVNDKLIVPLLYYMPGCLAQALHVI